MAPAATSSSFARLNGFDPKNPLDADRGLGCAEAITGVAPSIGRRVPASRPHRMATSGRSRATSARMAVSVTASQPLPRWEPDAPACTLSTPTIDTKVRPKAIGFRNEGTTNAFIICGYPTPDGSLTQFNINFTPIDGAAHSISCTGVNGPPWAPVYSAKVADSAGGQVSLSWTAADFGGTAGNDMPTGYMSVTCNLPGQVTVDNVYVNYNEDVGT